MKAKAKEADVRRANCVLIGGPAYAGLEGALAWQQDIRNDPALRRFVPTPVRDLVQTGWTFIPDDPDDPDDPESGDNRLCPIEPAPGTEIFVAQLVSNDCGVMCQDGQFVPLILAHIDYVPAGDVAPFPGHEQS